MEVYQEIEVEEDELARTKQRIKEDIEGGKYCQSELLTQGSKMIMKTVCIDVYNIEQDANGDKKYSYDHGDSFTYAGKSNGKRPDPGAA